MCKNTFSNIVRRFMAVFCVAVLLTTQVSVHVFAAGSKAADAGYLDKIEALEELGILLPEDEMQYSEENLTREKFAQIVSTFYNVPRTGDTVISDLTPSFTDVSSAYPHFAAIETAVRAGAMDGYTDKKFRPTETLTVGEAVRGMVVLLGYYNLVSYNGGDVSEYMAEAQKLGLLGGIKNRADQPITKGELVNLMFKAIDTDMLILTGYGSEQKYEVQKGKTLLSERLGVYVIEGILQATEITSVGNAEPCDTGYIRVNGYRIRTDADMSEYLGMYVCAYCSGEKDLSELELLHILTPQSRNQSFTVDAKDIVGFRNGTLSYSKNDKTKTVKITNDVSVIINGKNNPLYRDEDFLIEEGNITFLDADANGKYETVFVKSYMNVWVGQVYVEDDTVSIIDKKDTSKKYTLNNGDKNRTVVYKNVTGVTSYTSIKPDNIVSIAADKMDVKTKTVSDRAEYIEVLISDRQISGKPSKIDGTDGKITIDEEAYETAPGFDLKKYEISLGDTAKFYLNFFGKIVVAEKGGSLTYGILYGAESESNFKSSTAQVKIFTLDGVFKVFDCRNKLYIDGTLYKSATSVLETLQNSSNRFFTVSSIPTSGAGPLFQVIKYGLDSDGKLSEIDTVMPDSDDPDIEKNHLRFSTKIDENTRYFGKSYATTIDGGYVYDGNLKLFRIPSDLSNEDAFAVKKSLADALSYELVNVPLYCFDMDEYRYIPLAIVRSDTLENVPAKEDGKMMVLESVSQVLSEDDCVYTSIDGTSVKSGAKVNVLLKENSVLEESGAKPGDIIRWITDDLGFVTKIQVAMKNDGLNSKLYTGGYQTGYYSDFRITCGSVQNLNNKYILFKYGGQYETSLRNPSARILVYDSQKEKVSAGSYDSIKTVAAFGDEASLVFTYQWYTAIQTIVIFN